MDNFSDNFVKYLRTLPLEFNQFPEEFDYDNPVLILVDAVLSMNRKYESFVVPRVNLIRKKNIRTLEEALQLINSEGITGFCKIWDYQHPQRVEILIRLIKKFMKIGELLNEKNDWVIMRNWGKQSSVSDYKDFGVKGIGFTTFQYIRIMCGADTTKPDVHLTHAVKDGTGHKLPPEAVVQVVESSAKSLRVKAKQLDYALWHYYSNQSR